jgi:hypothetical protein
MEQTPCQARRGYPRMACTPQYPEYHGFLNKQLRVWGAVIQKRITVPDCIVDCNTGMENEVEKAAQNTGRSCGDDGCFGF